MKWEIAADAAAELAGFARAIGNSHDQIAFRSEIDVITGFVRYGRNLQTAEASEDPCGATSLWM